MISYKDVEFLEYNPVEILTNESALQALGEIEKNLRLMYLYSKSHPDIKLEDFERCIQLINGLMEFIGSDVKR